MPSPFYSASVVLFQLHGGMVSHMQAIAIPSSTVHNSKYLDNWASEASPTREFSIEISRDIYVSVVGQKV